MRVYLLFFFIAFSINLTGQYHSDALRLSKMEYMKYAQRMDCQGENNSSLEHRICLNLEFQQVDSLLNVKFKELCSAIKELSVKNQIIQYHESWIDYRRLQSKIVSKGYRGHMLGIIYLANMVQMTEQRLENVKFLLDYFQMD